MTIEELISELSKHPGDMQVWTSSDSEGNKYSPVDEISLFTVYETDEDDPDEKSYSEDMEHFMNTDVDEVIMVWPGWV